MGSRVLAFIDEGRALKFSSEFSPSSIFFTHFSKYIEVNKDGKEANVKLNKNKFSGHCNRT